MRELMLDLEQIQTLQQGFGVLAHDGDDTQMQVLPLAAMVSGRDVRLDGNDDNQLVLDWNQLVSLRAGNRHELRTRAGAPILVGGPAGS